MTCSDTGFLRAEIGSGNNLDAVSDALLLRPLYRSRQGSLARQLRYHSQPEGRTHHDEQSPDNYIGIRGLPVSRITWLLQDGRELTLGSHTVHVILASDHTSRRLNSFEVHDYGAPCSIIMMGGYGIFDPSHFRGFCEYPRGLVYAAK